MKIKIKTQLNSLLEKKSNIRIQTIKYKKQNKM